MAKTYTCPVAKQCGGCEWLSVPYAIQLTRKHEHMVELFEDVVKVEPVIGMPIEPLGYRNKIISPMALGARPAGQKREDRPRGNSRRANKNAPALTWGLYSRGTHNIVGCEKCLVEDPAARPIIGDIARMAPKFGIDAYNEDTGRGLLRNVLVRVGYYTRQVMVTLIINGTQLPNAKAFVQELRRVHPEITTVVVNINLRQSNVVLGERDNNLYGRGFIEDTLLGKTFRISSRSFYQTNPPATEILYKKAIELAGLTGTEVVADAYCGIGTIGLCAADSAKEIIGVERNADAIRDARKNAHINGIENATFVCGDATEYFQRMAADGQTLDVVLMDPPRAGSTMAFVNAVSDMGAKKVVYISCNPMTQRRDIEWFEHRGYEAKTLVPVDMFPHTKHLETIVLLELVGR